MPRMVRRRERAVGFAHASFDDVLDRNGLERPCGRARDARRRITTAVTFGERARNASVSDLVASRAPCRAAERSWRAMNRELAAEPPKCRHRRRFEMRHLGEERAELGATEVFATEPFRSSTFAELVAGQVVLSLR
jgi:hypothetical protein